MSLKKHSCVRTDSKKMSTANRSNIVRSCWNDYSLSIYERYSAKLSKLTRFGGSVGVTTVRNKAKSLIEACVKQITHTHSWQRLGRKIW